MVLQFCVGHRFADACMRHVRFDRLCGGFHINSLWFVTNTCLSNLVKNGFLSLPTVQLCLNMWHQARSISPASVSQRQSTRKFKSWWEHESSTRPSGWNQTTHPSLFIHSHWMKHEKPLIERQYRKHSFPTTHNTSNQTVEVQTFFKMVNNGIVALLRCREDSL